MNLFTKKLLRSFFLQMKSWSEVGVLPRNLVFVRHGLSEANEARTRLENGFINELPKKYLETPDREMRLEELIGQMQPKITGRYLKSLEINFDYATTSDHVRAYETAGLLKLDLKWFIECFYGERHWGEIDLQDPKVRETFYQQRSRNPYYATPPNGERLLSARHRARVLLERGARQHSLENFLGVFHGEMIEAIVSELLHLNTEEFIEFRKSGIGRMGNCQVLEFTRVCPKTKRVSNKMLAMRTSNPFLKEFGEWIMIDDIPFSRPRFKDAELLARAAKYPRFLKPLSKAK